MHRRHLIVCAGSAAATLALAGCAAGGPTIDIATAAKDIGTIAGGLGGEVTELGALGIAGFTPAAAAAVNGYIADLQQLATSVGAASSTSQAQSGVQQAESIANAAIGVLAVIPGLPPALSLGLQAVAVLLPEIETAVGLLINKASARRAKASALTPDQARLVLQSLANQK